MLGQTISHYKILEELGSGGMGVVYRAQDLKLGRLVAIKFLPAHLSSNQDAKKRFIHEAKAASALDHQNIGVVYEIDETADSRLFIVMAYYEAGSLQDQLEGGPLGVEEAVDIAIQIASGLAKAHEKGIVHRDVKPGNILLTEDGQAKLIDFGLAKLSGRTRLTKTGSTVGTVSYMSPEQVRGEDVDVRSDVFSLGIVLYELLTGHLPFKGDHEAAMLYSIVNQEPEPLAVHHQNLPEDFQLIIDKALQKDKHQRYENASEFKTDLEILKEESGSPSSLKVKSASQSRNVSRGISPLRVAALIAVAVGITAFWGWYLLRQDGVSLKPEEISLAILDFTQLETSDDQIRSASVMGLLQVGFVQNSPCRVVSPEYLLELRRRLFSVAEGPIGADQALEVARKSGATVLLSGQLAILDNDPYVLWRLVDTENGESIGGGRESSNSLAALADKVIAEVLFRLEALSGTEHPAILQSVTAFTTESPEAYRHYILGKIARDENRVVDAVQELERAIELDSTFALAYLEMSMAHYSGYSGGFNKDAAETFAKKAWDLRERLGIKDRLRIEARQYQLNDRLEDTLDKYRAMLSRWPDDHEVIAEFSELLIFHSHLNEAGSVIERGLELFPNDEQLSSSYGEILFNSNQPGKALEARRAHLEKFPKNPNEWDNLGRVYLQLGMPDSADMAFHKALKINSEFLWGQVGFSYSAYCRSDLAAAIEIMENTLGKTNLLPRERIWLLLQGAFPLSYLYLDEGRHQDALEIFESALTEFQGHSLETRIKIEQSLFHLHMGRTQNAELFLNNRENKSSLKFWAPYIRAELLLKLDSLDVARQLTEEYVTNTTSDNQYTTWSILLARIELADEQPQKALDVLEKLNERCVFHLGFEDIKLREIRSRALQKAGRLQESADELIELLRIYGGHAIARYELGQIFEEMGRSSEAVNEYEKFLDMWAQADEGLPQLESARLRLAVIKEP